jgi:hypothetical protein
LALVCTFVKIETYVRYFKVILRKDRLAEPNQNDVLRPSLLTH